MHCVNAIRHNSIEKTVAEYRLIDINAHFLLPIFRVPFYLLPKQLLPSLLDTNFLLSFFPTLSRLRNDLYCVEWCVKLYSNQPTLSFFDAEFSHCPVFPLPFFPLPLFHTLILCCPFPHTLLFFVTDFSGCPIFRLPFFSCPLYRYRFYLLPYAKTWQHLSHVKTLSAELRKLEKDGIWLLRI